MPFGKGIGGQTFFRAGNNDNPVFKVKTEARGKGYPSLVIDTVFEFAKKHGSHTAQSNPGPADFYRKGPGLMDYFSPLSTTFYHFITLCPLVKWFRKIFFSSKNVREYEWLPKVLYKIAGENEGK